MASLKSNPEVLRLDGDFFNIFSMEKGPLLGVGMTGEVISFWPTEDPETKGAAKTFTFIGNEDSDEILFEKEVSIMLQLDHSHVVKLLMAVRCPDYGLICMELYPGGDLERKVYDLEVSSVQRYLVQISCALKYLHSKRIAHCDVKLSNILLDSQDKAVLGDLGMCQRLAAGQTTVVLRDFGGTPSYWAPEASHNPDCCQVDPFKMDSYALGVTLWGMTLQERPSYTHNYLQELRETTDARTDLFRKWLELLLMPRPDDRPSVEQLLAILKAESNFGNLVDDITAN